MLHVVWIVLDERRDHLIVCSRGEGDCLPTDGIDGLEGWKRFEVGSSSNRKDATAATHRPEEIRVLAFVGGGSSPIY